jgi:hypothetical protein
MALIDASSGQWSPGEGITMVQATPPLSLTDPQHRICNEAFWILWRTNRSTPVDALAAALGMPVADVERELAQLHAGGRVRRDDTGAVTGAAGLAVIPTPHEMHIDGVIFHTWCVVDALGILGALGSSGVIRSTSPQTGRPIEVRYRDGQPSDGDLGCVVFRARYEPGTPVVQAWCPLVNFFEDEATARAWAAEHNAGGEIVPLAEIAPSAAQTWRTRLFDDTRPTS